MSIEEKQMTTALIEEKIKELERKRHTKIRDNVAACCRMENETIGKVWIQMNKERHPWDTITALMKPGSNPPEYEKHSSAMAKIARDYHNDLQQQGQNQNQNEETTNVMNNLTQKVSPTEKLKLAENIKQSEV